MVNSPLGMVALTKMMGGAAGGKPGSMPQLGGYAMPAAGLMSANPALMAGPGGLLGGGV
jgi:hypothetical protein